MTVNLVKQFQGLKDQVDLCKQEVVRQEERLKEAKKRQAEVARDIGDLNLKPHQLSSELSKVEHQLSKHVAVAQHKLKAAKQQLEVR